MNLDKKIDIVQKGIHKELVTQFKGLITNTCGNHIYDLEEKNNIEHFQKEGVILWIQNCGDSLNVYVLDPRYANFNRANPQDVTFKDNEECGFIPVEKYEVGEHKYYFGDTTDWCMIGHYHYDDFLYVFLNWEKEKKDLLLHIDRIFYNYYYRKLNKHYEEIIKDKAISLIDTLGDKMSEEGRKVADQFMDAIKDMTPTIY